MKLAAALLLLPLAVHADPPAARPVAAEADASGAASLESRLNPEQILELLKKREEVRVELARSEEAVRNGGKATYLVPTAIFLFLAVTLLGGLALRSRSARMWHETLRLMVEKGVNIPTDYLAPPARKFADLRRGIILVAAGLGLSVFIAGVASERDQRAWMLGAVPALIGAGYLVTWRVTREKSAA